MYSFSVAHATLDTKYPNPTPILSVNATSRDFHGITSKTSFANLLLSVAAVGYPPPLSPNSLPPRHEATPLLQFYFDNVFVQLPFFVETNFWTSVDAVYQSQGRFAKPFDHWMLRMVLAIASAAVSYQTNDKSHQRALALVSEALTYAEDVLRPGSITGIQAILLLAQYALVDPTHFRSWYLVGMAVRVAVDLGLHQDPPVEVLSNQSKLDIRRRVFHCLYGLDRFDSPVNNQHHLSRKLTNEKRYKHCPTANIFIFRCLSGCLTAFQCHNGDFSLRTE